MTHNQIISDKLYYESINFNTLMKILEKYITDKTLLHLVYKALQRFETFGGNFYEYLTHGIPKRSPLSPLLAGIALLPLDEAMRNNPHIFYARFVDDWTALMKSKTMHRKVIKETHAILNELGFEMHPTKTYIGKIEKGFNFLTYYLKPGVVLPSKEALRRFSERARLLYEQVVPSSFSPKTNRDISEYHVDETPPTDEDMQHILFNLNWWAGCKPDKKKELQMYLLRWISGLKVGLSQLALFEQSVKTHLPSLMLCWQVRTLPDVVSILSAQ